MSVWTLYLRSSFHVLNDRKALGLCEVALSAAHSSVTSLATVPIICLTAVPSSILMGSCCEEKAC